MCIRDRHTLTPKGQHSCPNVKGQEGTLQCTSPQKKPVDVVVGLAQLSLLSGERILRRKTKGTKEDMYYVCVGVLHTDLIRVRIQHKRERQQKTKERFLRR